MKCDEGPPGSAAEPGKCGGVHAMSNRPAVLSTSVLARDCLRGWLFGRPARLAVTIKPANVSGAFVAKLVEAINSTSPGELTSALGSDATVQQVEANILEQEYEATW